MTIESLWSYFDSLGESEQQAFNDEGLLLHRPLALGGYDSSPLDYLAFASTGGDGVHFSFPAGSNGIGLVVMTVPMAFARPNVVVGENLGEFFSLGCRFGYFSLEQLAYDFFGTAEKIQHTELQSPALASLSRQFDLNPWRNVHARLLELSKLLK